MAGNGFEKKLLADVAKTLLVKAVFKPPFFAFIFLTIASQSTVALAEKANQPQAQKVRVLDEHGEPIEGVSLVPKSVTYARRKFAAESEMVEKDAKKRGFVLSLGQVKTTSTNESGRATILLPPQKERFTTTNFWLKLQHDSYVQKNQEVDFGDAEVAIILERGCRVTASAIDSETKQPLSGNLYALTNRRWPLNDWKQVAHGTLISPLVGKETSSFRLIEIVDGKANRFSKLVEIVPDGKRKLLFDDLEMEDAVTVSGKLGDDFKGNLNHVAVSVCVASFSTSDKVSSAGPHSWCWKSSAFTKQDGSFVLKGIPSDSILQSFAACRGWSNKPLSQRELREHFPKAMKSEHWVLPQLSHIGKEDTSITIAMQPMGKAIVEVVDSDDRPISGVAVNVSPLQTFLYEGRSSWFGNSSSSVEDLIELRVPHYKFFLRGRVFRSVSFYSECSPSFLKSNEAGIATTCSIPAGKTPIHISCPGFESSDAEPRTSIEKNVQSGETSRVTVQLNRIRP